MPEDALDPAHTGDYTSRMGDTSLHLASTPVPAASQTRVGPWQNAPTIQGQDAPDPLGTALTDASVAQTRSIAVALTMGG